VLQPAAVERLGLRRGGEASCLTGIGELLQGLVPLFLRVDPGDVRVLAEALQPHWQAPALLLYDRVPNGVGLAERIFREHRNILGAALRLAEQCRCRSGCPGCIGPSAGMGGRSKQVAVAILRQLLGEVVAVGGAPGLVVGE
jgi:DEAD/DEAH box helicase domain-containing protein